MILSNKDIPRLFSKPRINIIESYKIFLCFYLFFYGDLALPKTINNDIATVKYEYAQILKVNPEISGIHKVNDLSIIKNIDKDLDALALIEINKNQNLTKNAIKDIVYIASKRYKIDHKFLKIIQTNYTGQIEYYLVNDPNEYLSENPESFKYLQWSYFSTDAEGNNVIPYFGYNVLNNN